MTWHLLGLKYISKVFFSFKRSEVLLQSLGIIFADDCQIHSSIISKKSDLRSFIFGQVIDVKQEQDWSKDRTLGHPRRDRNPSNDFPLQEPHTVNVRVKMH